MPSLAERLAELPAEERAKVLDSLTSDEAFAALHDWRGMWARPEQLAPDGDWDVWLVLAGRGFGKTRTGVEWIREEVEAGRATRIALVAETSADARDVMVEGESGILSVYPEGESPLYEPSKRRLTWPNGAVATLYNATEPDQLRGPQHDAALCDELAKWRYARETWDQLQFGMRLGAKPRICITTTPRPIPIIRDLLSRDGDGVAVTRGRTMDNRSNLAPSFFEAVVRRYKGTRLGRQELDAEVLDDVPGALWTREIIERNRVTEPPALKRIVVAVDPAANDGRTDTDEDPGENGIVCAGIGEDGRAYVLEDATLIASPEKWARRAVSTFDRFEADAVVVEVNQGGAMVASTLKAVRPNLRIVEVRASRGKHVRAEPISALYEQDRVSHVGMFAELEDQMMQTTAQGYLGDRSPDRLDAMVWALTELFPDVIRPPRNKGDLDPFARSPGSPGSWMGV